MMKKRLLSLLLTLCMVMSLVPVTVLAAEGDIDITEVNINGVTGELWSHSDAPFASVDDGANYTVESQNWYSDIAGEIKPDSADRKPKAGEEYTFTITLKANDGYVFPIKSESRVFYDGSFKLNGAEYDAGAVTVSSDGKTLVATMFILTKAKGVVLQNASVTNEAELIWALTNPDVNVITMKNDIAVSATLIVDRAVTLDLYGYMLEISGSGSVIKVEDGGHLTLKDSDLTSTYYFTPEADGLWKWGTTGTKTVNGGVIYGGTGSRNGDTVSGGGVYVDNGGTFTMIGGNIVGCTATIERVQAQGGGVYVAENGTFTMTSGSIAGCTAIAAQLSAYAMGGGICNEGTATLSGTAEIRECRITHAGNLIGGGIYDGGVLNISGDVKITGCRAEGLETEAMYTNIGGTIDGGFFDGSVWSHSTITDGTFNGEVINSNTITGGIFKGKVTNGGPISGGMFYGGITEGGVIRGCTVTYRVDGKDYAMQVLPRGTAALRPNDPTKDGYIFNGWYDGDTEYDFTGLVTGKITLTAKWIKIADKTADFTASDGGAEAIALLNTAKTGSADSTWDNDTKALTLKGVYFVTTATTAVKLPDGATVILADGAENRIIGGGAAATQDRNYQNPIYIYGIYAAGALTIQGETNGTGTLFVNSGEHINSGNAWTYSAALYADGDLTVKGGAVTAQGGKTSSAECAFSIGVQLSKGHSLSVSGGTLTTIGGESFDTGDPNDVD